MALLPTTLELPPIRVLDSYIEACRAGFYRGVQPKKTEDDIQFILADPEAFLAGLNAPIKKKLKTPDGTEFDAVPYETLWLVSDTTFIGEFSFRHELSVPLAVFGGHIGYGIRPDLQGQGYATKGLELVKERAHKMGIEKLLITCSPSNPASERVIVKAGGVYENTDEEAMGHGPIKRYWVATQS